jgi:hypothetical protein
MREDKTTDSGRKENDTPQRGLANGDGYACLLLVGALLVMLVLVGCGPSAPYLQAVDYTPLPGDDWKVSTPAEQGLDPGLVADFASLPSE